MYVRQLMEWRILDGVQWRWLWQPHSMFVDPPYFEHVTSPDLMQLYLIQLAMYIVMAVSHKFFESADRRKDYFVMYSEFPTLLLPCA